MLRRSTAATADNVDPAVFSPLHCKFSHALRLHVISAESIRQTGIRMYRYEFTAEIMKFLHMRLQFLRTKSTVETEGKSTGMTKRIIECLKSLTCKSSSRSIGYGTRYHNRQGCSPLFEFRQNGIHRSLCIQSIKNGLYHESVGTSVHETSDRSGIGFSQIIKGNISGSRIINIR